MPKPKRRWIVLGFVLLLLLVSPAVLWLCLTHQPDFYREVSEIPPERRHANAEKFVAQSLRLRNDIVNEPHWEAVFTDEQVNAWLAEDLVAHFADMIPPGVHDPRVVFDTDRVTLAFRVDEGPVRSVVWVVVRVGVPRENVVSLTLEKIRAGVLPIAPDQLIERITDHALQRGLKVRWDLDGEHPVALIRYTADPRRPDLVLETLQVLKGQVRLSGRSNRAQGAIASPTLPNRKVLQSNFPIHRRKIQPGRRNVSLRGGSGLQSSAVPWVVSPWSWTTIRSGDQTTAS